MINLSNLCCTDSTNLLDMEFTFTVKTKLCRHKVKLHSLAPIR